MEPLLKIATIETLYYDRIYALHGLSLEVKEKEIFTVLGPNGRRQNNFVENHRRSAQGSAQKRHH